MIIATMKIMVHPAKRDDALAILHSVTQQARIDPECISSSVYCDVESVNVIILEELWSNEEALERHLRSDDYYKVLLVAEMALAPPEIRFDTISSSAGIEFVNKARMG
jgi:quinol monooxygenase YgiN